MAAASALSAVLVATPAPARGASSGPATAVGPAPAVGPDSLVAPAPRRATTPAPALEPDDPCADPAAIRGSKGIDLLLGTPGPDVICGFGGPDLIKGFGGDDTIYAGDGDDLVFAGSGDDTVWGGAGHDKIVNDRGRDNLRGGDGDDLITGGRGDETLVGDAGRDLLLAGHGDDVLVGGDGPDRLDGQAGTDTCTSGETVLRCEIGEEVLEPWSKPRAVTDRSAPPGMVTASGQAAGVSVSIDSAGGIFPWEVQVLPARPVMGGTVARTLLASPAYDISVPASAPAFRSATITLPYRQDRLGDFPAEQLRVFTFDEATGLWLPAPGPTTVDTAARTVTTRVQHFSTYAVLKVGTPDEWRKVFGQTPVRCTGAGAGALDVGFVVDQSPSMATNDPTNLRIAAAKQFADRMRDADRAAVVTFSQSAVTRLGLTTLATPDDRARVNTALDTAATLIGGTNIPAAVRQITQVLSADPGPRVRVALLITDGESTETYDPALTTAAAAAGVQIYTIGLGSSIDRGLLQSIANGTGGQYVELTQAEQLPEIYQQLAGDIIDSTTDSDADGITDCVERNGAFVPGALTVPPTTPGTELAAFVTTDPANPDTDGDGLLDGAELPVRRFADRPELAQEYQFLVDQGLTSFYLFGSNPNRRDTDQDFLDDAREVANGTDPRVPDIESYGVDGLQVPPDTLVQPNRYRERPAIDSYWRRDGDTITPRLYNLLPISYDEERSCVENCLAINDLVRARPDDNGLFGFCFFGSVGDCVTDVSQARDVVEELRVKQGVFDEQGLVRQEYLQQQARYQCIAWTGDSPDCDDYERLSFQVRDDPAAAPLLAASAVAVLRPSGRGGIAIGPGTSDAIARGLIAAAAVVAGAAAVDQVSSLVRQCYALPVLRTYARITVFAHPCDVTPIFSPAGDVAEAAEHKLEAILERPSRARLQYAPETEVAARGLDREWYNTQPECDAAARARAVAARPGARLECDELPYYSTGQSGPGAALKLIDRTDNNREGKALQGFYLACPNVTAGATSAQRRAYLVVPVPANVRTIGVCRR